MVPFLPSRSTISACRMTEERPIPRAWGLLDGRDHEPSMWCIHARSRLIVRVPINLTWVQAIEQTKDRIRRALVRWLEVWLGHDLGIGVVLWGRYGRRACRLLVSERLLP